MISILKILVLVPLVWVVPPFSSLGMPSLGSPGLGTPGPGTSRFGYPRSEYPRSEYPRSGYLSLGTPRQCTLSCNVLRGFLLFVSCKVLEAFFWSPLLLSTQLLITWSAT